MKIIFIIILQFLLFFQTSYANSVKIYANFDNYPYLFIQNSELTRIFQNVLEHINQTSKNNVYVFENVDSIDNLEETIRIFLYEEEIVLIHLRDYIINGHYQWPNDFKYVTIGISSEIDVELLPENLNYIVFDDIVLALMSLSFRKIDIYLDNKTKIFVKCSELLRNNILLPAMRLGPVIYRENIFLGDVQKNKNAPFEVEQIIEEFNNLSNIIDDWIR